MVDGAGGGLLGVFANSGHVQAVADVVGFGDEVEGAVLGVVHVGGFGHGGAVV